VATFEVGIVGGGIHGASAAYHLGSRGVRTVVFERGAPASGPTGLSSGICRAYYTNVFLASVARDGIRMIERFQELTGTDAAFRRTGMLFMHPPEDAAAMRASAERLNGLGIETEVLTPGEIAERFPPFDLEGVGVGGYEVHAGYADPHATTEGLFRRAVELGVEARLGSTVGRVEADPRGGGALVASDGERTSCERILIAAGPWTRPLARQVGVDLPLTVERHIVATFGWGSSEPMPAHTDLIGGYYFRPEGDDLYIVGSVHPAERADPDDYPSEITPDEIEGLARLVVRRVPQLERSEARGGWASLYDVSPDWQPVIGEIAPGIFVDAGSSGHGFKIAPALGKHVADLVMGEEVDPGLAAFDPFRFERGTKLEAGYREARILG
jgi:glycine/D-amino acid oxidase-like deaminating enzyme